MRLIYAVFFGIVVWGRSHAIHVAFFASKNYRAGAGCLLAGRNHCAGAVAFLAGKNHRAGTGFRTPGSDGVSASFHTPGDDSLTNVLVVEKME
jgi:hypothetical protein